MLESDVKKHRLSERSVSISDYPGYAFVRHCLRGFCVIYNTEGLYNIIIEYGSTLYVEMARKKMAANTSVCARTDNYYASLLKF